MSTSVVKSQRSLFVNLGGTPPIHFERMTPSEYRRHKDTIAPHLAKSLRKAMRAKEYFLAPIDQLPPEHQEVQRETVQEMATVFNCSPRMVHMIGTELRTGIKTRSHLARGLGVPA